MRVKEGFILRNVADENIVIYLGEEEGAFEGMIQLNPMGAYLWKKMVDDISFDTLVDDLVGKYGYLERNRVASDLKEFLDVINFAIEA